MSAAFLVEYAKSFLGVPYVWAGDTPMGGLDCSGFTGECGKAFGIIPGSIDLNSQSQYGHFLLDGGKVLTEAQVGAYLFFGQSVSKITHVAIALDNRFMIEAGGGGSQTTDLKSAIAKKAFVRIRPIRNRKDLVAIVMPNY